MALGRHRGARPGAARSARVRRRRTPREVRIVRIGTKDGLFDEVIHQILEDDVGRLWMNTNRGIFWVARAELNAFADGQRLEDPLDGVLRARRHAQPRGERRRAAGRREGARRTALVPDAGWRRRRRSGEGPPRSASRRRWWWSRSSRAGARFARSATRSRSRPISATCRSSTPRSRSSSRRTSASATGSIRTTRAGSTSGNRRTAFYTKVPPGRYTFRVEASDAAGGWYEPGTRLAVRVLPRVWETGVFRWASVAAFGVLLVVAVRVARGAPPRARAAAGARGRRAHRRRCATRERELADRNAQLQSLDHAKTRFFANVSHELRTPLTLTIGPLEDLRARAGGDPQVERWLDIALRNCAASAPAGESDPRRGEARGGGDAPRAAPARSGSVHARRGRRVRAGRRAKGHSPDGGDARRAARRVRRRCGREDPHQPPLERHQVHAERRDGARRARRRMGNRRGSWSETPARASRPTRSPTSSSDSTRWTSRRPARSRERGSGSRW